MSRTLVKNEKIKDIVLEDKLIHEHDFVTVRAATDTNNYYYLIQCAMCGQYFCQICGKALSLLSSRQTNISKFKNFLVATLGTHEHDFDMMM